jgi:hypothetical protein
MSIQGPHTKGLVSYVGVLIRLWLFLFAARPKEIFLDGLKKLEQRSHKCVELREGYVEQIRFINPVACRFLYKVEDLSAIVGQNRGLAYGTQLFLCSNHQFRTSQGASTFPRSSRTMCRCVKKALPPCDVTMFRSRSIPSARNQSQFVTFHHVENLTVARYSVGQNHHSHSTDLLTYLLTELRPS